VPPSKLTEKDYDRHVRREAHASDNNRNSEAPYIKPVVCTYDPNCGLRAGWGLKSTDAADAILPEEEVQVSHGARNLKVP